MKRFEMFPLGLKVLVLLCFLLNTITLWADGGMYPVNQLDKELLKKAGLKIDISEIYNPDSISLLHTIVNLGGCTGSFVSKDGLILTNHHCVFSSLKALSTSENNLMDKGFLAGDRGKELPLKGMKVKIMLNYDDVSAKVLVNVASEKDPVKRRALISANIESVMNEERMAHPELEIEISEMLSGRSYIVFRYAFLNDIRLVYVPQREIGEFGGETDNWMWPRHSGDFSFIRAYVAADGSPAPFNINNVPFKPVRFLKVSTAGVQEEDFVFILGYPGRTFRNRPAAFIKYMENVQMPFIAEYFEYIINYLTEITLKDPVLKVKYDATIKSLANTSKNYRGKLQSLARIHLYENRVAEENIILSLLKSDLEKAESYKKTLDEINFLYNKLIDMGPKTFWYAQLYNWSTSMNIAANLVQGARSLQSLDPKSEEYKKTLSDLQQRMLNLSKSVDRQNEAVYFLKLLQMAEKFANPVAGLSDFMKNAGYKNAISFVNEAYENELFNEEMLLKLFRKPLSILNSKNVFIRFYLSLEAGQNTSFDNQTLWLSSIDALLPVYIDLKMQATGNTFIPDANSTLRLTFGYIRGYYPADGVYASPFTHIEGIPEKVAKGGEYLELPELVMALDNTRVSRYYDKRLSSIPVNFLYNTDTSGGNSGSPVLNAHGELVGLNFDRTFEATVNDFAWNEAYSRSVGVDIRYILFITSQVGKANHLLEEMNAL